MIRNLDIRLLRTFATVARCSSMTAASDVLHMTQGAVSQHIKRLEEQLGSRLLERARGGLTLTVAGENLLLKAEELLRLNDHIFTEFGATGAAGQLRIGMPYDLVGRYFPLIVQPYSNNHPHVDVSLVGAASPELANALAAGQIDLAVLEEPIGLAGGERLTTDRLVWVGSKDGEAYRKRPLPVSLIGRACAFRPAISSALNEQGISWKALYSYDNLDATVSAIRADLAVGAWLRSALPADLSVLTPDSGLPDLPDFALGLHVSPHVSGSHVLDLAENIRAAFTEPRTHDVVA